MPVKKYQDPAQFQATKQKVAALVTAAGPSTVSATNQGTGANALPATTGTKPVRYKREELAQKWNGLTHRALDYLSDGDRFETMLAETKLEKIAVFLGIATEKVLLLEGQPTTIIGQPQQAKLDQLGPALQTLLQQRGLAKNVTLTERTATINLEQQK